MSPVPHHTTMVLPFIILGGTLGFVVYMVRNKPKLNVEKAKEKDLRQQMLEIQHTGISRELASRKVDTGGAQSFRKFDDPNNGKDFPPSISYTQKSTATRVLRQVALNEKKTISVAEEIDKHPKEVTRPKNDNGGSRLAAALTPVTTTSKQYRKDVLTMANNFY